MSFGSKVRILRKEKNMTQAQLAELLGISERTVSFIETGKYYPKNEEMIRKIADYFKVTSDYLFGLSNDKNFRKLNEIRECFDSLNEQGQEDFMQYVEFLKLKNKNE